MLLGQEAFLSGVVIRFMFDWIAPEKGQKDNRPFGVNYWKNSPKGEVY